MDWSKSIPQDSASQDMYEAYLGLGVTPAEAAKRTLFETLKSYGGNFSTQELI